VLKFIVRRLIQLIPILIGLSILVFVWIRALPGGPAEALLGERLTPESRAQIEEQYGLDDPLPVQYWRYVKTTVVDRDLGTSINTRRPVSDELKERFPATIELAIAAMLFAMVLGVPLGYVAAKRYGGPIDQASLVLSLLGVSIPIFFLAILLKYIFALQLGLLPTVGRISVLIELEHPTNFYVLDAIIAGDPEALWDVIKHLILPAIALGSIPLAIVARITRAATLDVQNEDYVRTARAKGLSPRVVDRRHIFRNALLPIATIIGLQTGLLLSGAVLTETVFAWPGMGTWLVEAIENRNYPVLQGGILFVSLVFVFVNLLVDLSYALINPRIRVS
jgi:peptide/nickel transport system permease protein